MAIQLKGNSPWAGGSMPDIKTEGTAGLEQTFSWFAGRLVDPAALSEPIGGPGTRGGARGLQTEEEERGERVRPRGGPPPPRKRSGGRSGGGVAGHGPASPGGIYTPDPGV